MAEGQPNAAIADRLGVSERAVDMTVRDLIGKLSLEASAHDQRRVLAVLTFLGA
jgi:DNA-binding CsgD family transcriptional regulator